jgi:hypothetical protein
MGNMKLGYVVTAKAFVSVILLRPKKLLARTTKPRVSIMASSPGLIFQEGMMAISSIGTPDPVGMRKLLNYLARRKMERMRLRAQARKAAARKNARRRQAVRA